MLNKWANLEDALLICHRVKAPVELGSSFKTKNTNYSGKFLDKNDQHSLNVLILKGLYLCYPENPFMLTILGFLVSPSVSFSQCVIYCLARGERVLMTL